MARFWRGGRVTPLRPRYTPKIGVEWIKATGLTQEYTHGYSHGLNPWVQTKKPRRSGRGFGANPEHSCYTYFDAGFCRVSRGLSFDLVWSVLVTCGRGGVGLGFGFFDFDICSPGGGV